MKIPKSRTLSFLTNRPTRPTTLPDERIKSKLGSNYDTAWSRKYPVRLVRAMVIDSVVRPAIQLVAKPDTRNVDRIDGLSGPVIFAVNHSSHIDTAVMLSILPDRFRHRCVVGAGADYFFDKRWKAALWSGLLSAIPIERNRAGRRSADLASGLIRDGWSLLIFPEGGRSPDGLGQEFRGGVALLAQKTGAPIVPIYLEGTYDILNKNDKRFKPGTVMASYGSPISANDGRDPREVTIELQRAVDRLADEFHTDFLQAARNAHSGDTPSLQPSRRGWIELWDRSGLSESRDSKRTGWPQRLIQR